MREVDKIRETIRDERNMERTKAVQGIVRENQEKDERKTRYTSKENL